MIEKNRKAFWICLSVLATRIQFVGTICMPNWQQYGDFCYSLPTNFNVISPDVVDSYNICINISGNLPTFRNSQDWNSFVSFITANGVTGASALGYMIYDHSVTNPNTTFTSMFDGQSTQYTNWASGQPDASYGFSSVQYFNMTWMANDWNLNPLTPVCQQAHAFDQNTTTVQCTPVCRSSSNKGHRYTVDGPYCPSGGMTVDQMNIGYTPTFFVPGLTGIVYEVLNPTTGFIVMTYNSSGLNFVTTLGYNSVQRIIYVSTIPSDSASLFYHFYDKPNPNDSIITKDVAEYNQLVNDSWVLIATYYMYDSQLSNGECSLAQNCTWNAWQAWSTCSVTCNDGTMIRSRTKNITESHGGLCDNSFNESSVCNLISCPINCTWNSWLAWSACSLSCNNGTQTRIRTKNVTENYGGTCDDVYNDTTSCNSNNCPENCIWNSWQGWSTCSTTCGNGITDRSRTKSVVEAYGGACNNVYNDTAVCNTNPCPLNCVWNSWQDWSQCSSTCGNGTASRRRTKLSTELYGGSCDNVFTQNNTCNNVPCPINCTWNFWSPWSACSLSCNNGTKSRQRNKTTIENYGGTCDNVFSDTSSCNSIPCPIDCIWNSWEEWSNCSLPCGSGVIERLRTKNVTNMYSGQCDNVYKETNSCNTNPCPIDCELTQWSSFGSCSVTCGDTIGTQRRSRVIVSQAIHGGTPCPNNLQEYRNCSSQQICIKEPMNPFLRTVATVMQSIGCSSMVGALAAILFFFALLRIWTFERILHMCQELALFCAHLLICLFAFKQQADAFHLGMCFIVSILLQYFFLVYYAFLILECVNSYCILTNVVTKQSLFSIWQPLVFGWGAPAIVTVTMTAIFHSQYTSEYSCWVNWGIQSVSASSMLPILLCLFISMIIAEAASMDKSVALFGIDPRKRAAARVSRDSMIILIPLHVVFWLFASNAIYYQNIALYTTVMALNVSVAVTIFIAHVSSNEQVHHYVSTKVFSRFKRKNKKQCQIKK